MTDRDRPDTTESQLADADPTRLAGDTGSQYIPAGEGAGEFRLAVWGREARIAFPTFEAMWTDTSEGLDPFTAALLACYFASSDGTAEAGSRIAFGELRDATPYARAFQGYTGNPLAKTFGNDAEAPAAAARTLGGVPEPLVDHPFSFLALPLVSVTVACWLGDEDFGPSYRVLFDVAVGHHLPTDVCAIVGSSLTRQLIAAHGG